MKSALILALAGSAVAAPSFGDFLDALFGGDNNDHHPQPSDFPSLPPLGTGTGPSVPYPFPTATGAPIPHPGSNYQKRRNVQTRPLHIDYELASKAVPVVKRSEPKYRQLDPVLPSFSLLDPNETPPATGPASSLPTEFPTELPGSSTGPAAPVLSTRVSTDLPSLPTASPAPPAESSTAPYPCPTGGAPAPSGGAPVPSGEAPCPADAPFPTAPAGTGAPDMRSLPTTFGTVTRGPQPTTLPDASGQESDETENGNAWLDWISDLLTGEKSSQH